MPNLFTKAKSASPAKAAKKQKAEMELGGDLDTLAAITALMKSLEGLKVTVESEVKTKMADRFVVDGMLIGKKPDNYRGISENAQASLELRKRSSRSPLRPEEIELCAEYGVATKPEGEMYYFNPKVIESQAAMEKISRALAKVELAKEIGFGEDIILKKEGAVVTTEESLDQVFAIAHAKKDRSVADRLLTVVGTLGVKPRLNVADINVAFNILKDNGLALGGAVDAE